MDTRYAIHVEPVSIDHVTIPNCFVPLSLA